MKNDDGFAMNAICDDNGQRNRIPDVGKVFNWNGVVQFRNVKRKFKTVSERKLPYRGAEG